MNKTGMHLDCKECGVSFYANKMRFARGQKYCSFKCRDIAKRKTTYDDIKEMKRCACCGEWKPFSMYSEQKSEKSSKTGISLQAYCRPCSLKKSNEWAELNKKAKAIHKKEANKRAKDRGYVYVPSAEQTEKYNASQREYRKKNMSKVLMWNRLRRHKERAAGALPHPYEIGILLCEQDAKCVYCGVLLSDKYHIDHKTPVSRGGTNDLENLQLLCVTCNLKKSAKTHTEYSMKLLQA